MYYDPHTLISVGYAFLGGIVPSIIWLLFWMREDREHPEPLRMIIRVFVGGMFAVIISLILEKLVFGMNPSLVFRGNFLQAILAWLSQVASAEGIDLSKLLLVVVFAPIIEETAKFFMAWILALRTKADIWAIDPMIYMIVTALGFAALENMLFLFDPILRNNLASSITTGDMRFIGATLLHTVASSTIGIMISFHFFNKKISRSFWTLVGLISAIFIHSLFNLLMVQLSQASIIVLEAIWILVIIVLLAFEKIKQVRVEKIEA